MSESYNFSVIIPHKNIPMMLERLIKTIPLRDDLEIIVVDDHSDVGVVDYEHFPCKGRKNLTLVLNHESHGAGFARNCALSIVKGKWILFADSDDFYNQGFNIFLNEYLNCEADVVYFNANSVDSETYEELKNECPCLEQLINKFDLAPFPATDYSSDSPPF